eukprot:1507679-Prorocentrum_lima.AAC.1
MTKELDQRLAMVRPALRTQLQDTALGAERLAPVRNGGARRRRNAALHSTVFSGSGDLPNSADKNAGSSQQPAVWRAPRGGLGLLRFRAQFFRRFFYAFLGFGACVTKH